MEREMTISTAVEEGIAFPHARVEAMRKPLLIFARSERGIEWNSPDGKLSQIIFLILTPIGEDDLQVQILGSLARIMMDPQNRDKLLMENDPGRIKEILSAALRPR
jgi:PTS system fructose-specific IIC component